MEVNRSAIVIKLNRRNCLVLGTPHGKDTILSTGTRYPILLKSQY